MNNMYAHIFGESEATKQARENRNNMFQAMLDSRKQAAEQQRTDDVKMAKYNALGNVLTSMVQPLGWRAGGGSTGGVQPYDNRQYLEAFNRAVKASDNLRNIGLAEDEYKLKIADEDYRRAQALDDDMRRYQQKIDAAEREARIWAEKEATRQANTLEAIEARGDVQKWLAEYRAAHRVTGRGGMSVDDRALIAARNNYEQYKRTLMTQGTTPPTFEEYLKGEGINVTDTTAKPSASPAPKPAATATTKPAGKTGGFKTGGTTATATTTNSGKTGGFKH